MVGFQPEVPFPAIIGQDRLKRVLLAVAVNEELDGLLVRGEKGTAKSTAVRGLVDLLPTQRAVEDCPYGCPPETPSQQCDSCQERTDPPVTERPVPLVTVPLGATRERVVGSLSLSDALDGETTFEPGLLAQANRGFLYVDEVNLLDDHLVDVLLDAAASGVNQVERDGVSRSHPAAFTLIGTMNPEEGDLRPQLRDRFALQVEVAGSEDLQERVAIVQKALDRNARTDSTAETDAAIERLRETIVAARDRLETVTLPDELAERIGTVCIDAGVDGHRGDIAAARAARTFAALDGVERVTEAHVEEALRFALPHRLQSRPFEDTTPLEDVLEDHFGDGEPDTEEEGDQSGENGDGDSADGAGDSTGSAGDPGEQSAPGDDGDGDEEHAGGSSSNVGNESPPEQRNSSPQGDPKSTDTQGSEAELDSDTPQRNGSEETASEGRKEDEDGRGESETGGENRQARPPATPAETSAAPGSSTAPDLEIDPSATSDTESTGSGRAETDQAVDATGPRIRTEPADSPETVDMTASIREGAKQGRTELEPDDLKQSVRAGEATALVVFAVDASASMGQAMRAAKGTVLELLKESYRERDEVAFVAFAGEKAEVLLPPTDSVSLAARHLKDLPTGDRTPLPAGLETATAVIDRAEPAASVAVVVTDGRPNVATGSPTAATREAAEKLGANADEVLVVDASQPDDRATLVSDLVTAAEARVIPLRELSETSVHAVTDSARQ